MKKLLLAALIMQICRLSYAMDIIEIQSLDGHRAPNRHVFVVFGSVVQALNTYDQDLREAREELQHIARKTERTYNTLESSQPQRPVGRIKRMHTPQSKL